MSAIFQEDKLDAAASSMNESQMDQVTKQSSRVIAMSEHSSDEIPSEDDMMMEMDSDMSDNDEEDDIERDPNSQTMQEPAFEKLEMEVKADEQASESGLDDSQAPT